MAEPNPHFDVSTAILDVFEEVNILLEFLGRRPDSRLQAHFEEGRGNLAAPTHLLSAPPCSKYAEFLARLISIRRMVDVEDAEGAGARHTVGPDSTANAIQAPANARPTPIDDLTFLYLSRDFLAAIAAPATVESIVATQAYVAARQYSLWWRWLSSVCSAFGPRPVLGSQDQRIGPNILRMSPSPTETDGDMRKRFGVRLAYRVVKIEFLIVVLTMLTLLISAYAFSGHAILESQQKTVNEYRAISQAEEAYGNISLHPLANCDPGNLEPNPEQRIQPETKQSDGYNVGNPSNATKCLLYWRNKIATGNIVAVNLHLMSWTRIADKMFRPIPQMFGISPVFIRKSAQLHPEYCKVLRINSNECGIYLTHLVYRAPEVVDAILGAVAIYLLPVLYGCLGAGAATLRQLRRKVDLCLVTPTDRGRVLQDMTLGLLSGAVIGLFAGYINAVSPTTGLGLSALAFLAGYNVPGMFGFLDEVSRRIFQPAPPGGPSHQ